MHFPKFLDEKCPLTFCISIADVPQRVPAESLIKFKQGLISLLQSKDSNKVPLESLEREYESFHGSCPLLKNLGFNHPNDLFEAMKPEIEVDFLWLFLCLPVFHFLPSQHLHFIEICQLVFLYYLDIYNLNCGVI